MGPGGFIGLVILGALVAYPFSRILPRYGINPWWAIVAVTWLGALILLWVVALREPEERR